ncbi:MAG: O-antigen ligase family protein [Ruminococcaceae bacterium]|nr:O-antigen ligase family protein [Oscillospiraceae bacterium]
MGNTLVLNKPHKLLSWLLAFFFVASPCDYVMPHFGAATVLWLLGLIISIFCVMDLMLFGNKKFVVTTDNSYLLFLSVFAIISMLWAEEFVRAQNALVSFISVAAMYFMLFLYKFTEKDIKRIEYASIIGGFIMIYYVFTQVDLDRVMAGFRLDFDTIATDDSSSFSDPNGLSARLMMPLVFSFKYFFESKKLWQKLICIAEIGGIVYIMFLTGSRAAVITLALVVFIVLFKNLSGKRAGTALVMIFGVIIALLIFPGLLPEHIYNRIFNFAKYQEVMTYEGDRIDVWKNAITQVFPKSPIFGSGIGNSSVALREVYGKIKAVHSSWLVFLIELGLFGFVFWMSFVIGKIKLSFKLNSKSIYPVVITLAVIVMATTLDGQREKYLWNTFLYSHMLYTSYYATTFEDQNKRLTQNEDGDSK